MSTYKFAGSLYPTVRDLCDAIAVQWLGADGANHNDDIRRFQAEETDAELASDAIKHWFSEAGAMDDEEVDAMEFEPSDLEAAFRRLRDPERFQYAFGDDE